MQTHQPDHRLLGAMLVLISGLLYGMIGYFGMQLFKQGFSVSAMLFWRFLVAAGWMLLMGVVTRRSFANTGDNLWYVCKLAMVGAVSYSGGSAFFYLSSLHIGTGPAMVIFFSFPVFVTLFSLFYKQAQLNGFLISALMMVVIGMVCLNGRGEYNLDNWGIFLALIAAFSYGVYVYYSKGSAKSVDTLWLTFFICLGCAIIFLIFSLGTSTWQIPETNRAWRDILILGIVSTAIPIQLLLNGLKYISSVKASILSVMEPVTTVVAGVMLLDERLSTLQMIGILIVLSGAIIIQFEKTRK